ncbi:hypothetical protein SEA_NANCYRAE_56 [Gordonia phage NancyRae]|uniref:Lipoprotein n=1 Tax=Gordonia phage NancyRae TaxID=2793698 RepID=A0A7T0M0U9_9CAUD|nr:hypothetical protein SEA_NANCYRAE_56 [Gordonia phage NancyRae]
MRKIQKATVAVVLGVAVAVSAGCSNFNQEWHTGCTVTGKDTLYAGSGGDTQREYRLSTSCGTFTVGDTLAGGFNSWDTWTQLREGETYDLRTGGYRIGLFSQFPTVIEIR